MDVHPIKQYRIVMISNMRFDLLPKDICINSENEEHYRSCAAHVSICIDVQEIIAHNPISDNSSITP